MILRLKINSSYFVIEYGSIAMNNYITSHTAVELINSSEGIKISFIQNLDFY